MRSKRQQRMVSIDPMNPPPGPHVIEAERAVLGAILVDQAVLDVVQEEIRSEDLYQIAHQKVFEAMNEIAQKGGVIDSITITNALRDRGDLDCIGGVAYLSQLVSEAAISSSVPWYCNEIGEKAGLRKLAGIATRALSLVHGSDTSCLTADEVAQQFERLLDQYQCRGTAPTVTLSTAVNEAALRLQKRLELGQDTVGLSTGYPALDRKVGGLRPGEMTILAARPGMGKTTLATNIVLAEQHVGTGILWVSPEVGRENIADKVIAHQGRVNGLRLRTGLPNEELIDTAVTVAEGLRERRVFIYDEAAPTVPQIAGVLMATKRRHPIDLLVIDHLLRLTPTSNDESAERRIADMVRGIGTLARRTGVHVILLTQLNRLCEARSDRRPILSDLQGSGSTEQDADNVWFCYRDEYYLREKCPAGKCGVMELIISKARYGEPGTVLLLADMATGRVMSQEPCRTMDGLTSSMAKGTTACS